MILTLKQFLDRYQISRSTWYRMVKGERAPAYYRLGGQIRLDEKAVLRWLKRGPVIPKGRELP